MLGILAKYRSNNLGFLLKCAQREAALKLGIKRITWTFDPLQSRNAHLNFNKLGVIADRYYVDYYGVTSSFLHRFGTDRLWVTWLLESERVKSRLQLNASPRVVHDEDVVIEIPAEITENHEHWRVTTRDEPLSKQLYGLRAARIGVARVRTDGPKDHTAGSRGTCVAPDVR